MHDNIVFIDYSVIHFKSVICNFSLHNKIENKKYTSKNFRFEFIIDSNYYLNNSKKNISLIYYWGCLNKARQF